MPLPEPNYVHHAVLVSVVDGDSYDLRIDLGRYSGVTMTPTIRTRLRAWDAPDRDQPIEREAARITAESHMHGRKLRIKTHKFTFERTLVDVEVLIAGEWLDLGRLLASEGHAEPRSGPNHGWHS